MTFTLTCHTSGCENEGFAIQFADPANTVICGPCGQEITDKQQVNLSTEITQE